MDNEHEYNPYKPSQKRPQQSQTYNNQPRQNYTEQQKQTTQENWNRCPRCGVITNGNFCSNCGLDFRAYYNQIQSQSVHSKSTKQTKKNKISPLLIIGILIWIPFIAVVMLYSIFQSQKQLAMQGQEIIQQEIENNNNDTFDEVGDIDYYMSTCSDLDYISLARDPKSHLNNRVKFVCKVAQIMNNDELRVYVEDSDGYFYKHEMIVKDNRSDKSLKLLQDDILMVYGEVTDPLLLTRTLTDEEVEVIHVKGMLIDILANGENEYKSQYKNEDTDELVKDTFVITTSGDTNGKLANDSDKELVNGYENPDIYCYYPVVEGNKYIIKIEVDNKVPQEYIVDFSDITINGYQFNGGSVSVNGEHKAIDTINIYKSDLKDAGIDKIDTIIIPMSVRWVTNDNGLTYNYYETNSFEVTLTLTQ